MHFLPFVYKVDDARSVFLFLFFFKIDLRESEREQEKRGRDRVGERERAFKQIPC